MTSILIIAGESSGDIYGADLVHEFKKRHPHVNFFGIGGSQMEKEGVRLLFPSHELAVVGLIEVLGHLPRIKKIFDAVIGEAERAKPSAAVLIDSPDFNLRLAKRIKKLSVPILYYISPTVWIWRKGRLRSIKKTVKRMMLIFPFEEDIYRQRQIPAVYIGHPLVHKISVSLNRRDFFSKYELDLKKKTICLLPGSRRSEIHFHMPTLVKAMDNINQEHDVQFVLVQANNLEDQILDQHIPGHLSNLLVIREEGYSAMSHSDLAISACGTANLELAILETPFLAFYRLSSLTYHFGIHLLKLKHFSIVNILSGKKVITELIQSQFTAENLTLEVRRLLTSQQSRDRMIADFRNIKDLLGDRKASYNAALELEMILEQSGERI
jgi:lipid-A-disaccharide synthase